MKLSDRMRVSRAAQGTSEAAALPARHGRRHLGLPEQAVLQAHEEHGRAPLVTVLLRQPKLVARLVGRPVHDAAAGQVAVEVGAEAPGRLEAHRLPHGDHGRHAAAHQAGAEPRKGGLVGLHAAVAGDQGDQPQVAHALEDLGEPLLIDEIDLPVLPLQEQAGGGVVRPDHAVGLEVEGVEPAAQQPVAQARHGHRRLQELPGHEPGERGQGLFDRLPGLLPVHHWEPEVHQVRGIGGGHQQPGAFLGGGSGRLGHGAVPGEGDLAGAAEGDGLAGIVEQLPGQGVQGGRSRGRDLQAQAEELVLVPRHGQGLPVAGEEIAVGRQQGGEQRRAVLEGIEGHPHALEQGLIQRRPPGVHPPARVQAGLVRSGEGQHAVEILQGAQPAAPFPLARSMASTRRRTAGSPSTA